MIGFININTSKIFLNTQCYLSFLNTFVNMYKIKERTYHNKS